MQTNRPFNIEPMWILKGVVQEIGLKSLNIVYLCGYEWLYSTYFGRFWGFIVDCEAVAMGQVFPLG